MSTAFDALPMFPRLEAIELLEIHSFTFGNIYDPRMENGFLGSLRPYQGSLNHDAFHEVMACIKSLGPEFAKADAIDRRVISNLWGICQLARAWAIYPHGMLRSNNLISDDDIETMDTWIDCISYAVMMYLEGSDGVEAFSPYEEYVKPHDKNAK